MPFVESAAPYRARSAVSKGVHELRPVRGRHDISLAGQTSAVTLETA
jgi:hypothetical protein